VSLRLKRLLRDPGLDRTVLGSLWQEGVFKDTLVESAVDFVRRLNATRGALPVTSQQTPKPSLRRNPVDDLMMDVDDNDGGGADASNESGSLEKDDFGGEDVDMKKEIGQKSDAVIDILSAVVELACPDNPAIERGEDAKHRLGRVNERILRFDRLQDD
jgi:hypothetical protein